MQIDFITEKQFELIKKHGYVVFHLVKYHQHLQGSNIKKNDDSTPNLYVHGRP